MQVKNSKELRKYTLTTLQKNSLYSNMAYMLADSLNGCAVFDDIDFLSRAAAEFQQNQKLEGNKYSNDESMIAVILLILIRENGVRIPDISTFQLMVKNGRVIRGEDILGNPYLKNVKVKPGRVGKWKIKTGSIDKDQVLIYDYFINDTNFVIPSVAIMQCAFDYPCIAGPSGVWMTITPNEIYTMQPAIDKAHGRVLTLGCGLGYFAYMCACRDDIESVTIVEREPEVIELFRKQILPAFPDPDKVRIIQEDAFPFMEKLEDDVFDYCFVDLWQGNTGSALIYARMKEIARKFQKMELSYWIEDSLVATDFSPMILTMAASILLGKDYSTDYGLPGMPPYIKKLLDYTEVLLKNVKINTVDELKHYTNPYALIKMIEEKPV